MSSIYYYYSNASNKINEHVTGTSVVKTTEFNSSKNDISFYLSIKVTTYYYNDNFF